MKLQITTKNSVKSHALMRKEFEFTEKFLSKHFTLTSLSSVSQIFCQIEFLHIFAFHNFFLSLHYCPFVATSKWTIYHFSNAWNDSKLQFYTNQLVPNWVLDNFGWPKFDILTRFWSINSQIFVKLAVLGQNFGQNWSNFAFWLKLASKIGQNFNFWSSKV